MKRRNYLLPRLLLLLVIVLGVALTSDRLVKRMVVHCAQTIRGADFVVDDVHVHWREPAMTISGFRLKHQDGLRLQADRIKIMLDYDELSRRRFVVTDGYVHGMRLEPPSLTETAVDSSLDLARTRLTRAGRLWLENAADVLARDPSEELRSTRAAMKIMERWPPRYESLLARAKAVTGQVAQTREAAGVMQQNPLRATRTQKQLSDEIRGIRSEIADIRDQFDRFLHEMAQDKHELAQAKEQDVQALRQSLGQRPLNGSELSNYLFGEQLARHANTSLCYLRCVRTLMPDHAHARPRQTHQRGQTVSFQASKPGSPFQIRSLVLQGQATVWGHSVPVDGVLTGLCAPGSVSDEPARLSFKGDGQVGVSLRASVLRSESSVEDIVEFDIWGAVPQDQTIVGSPQLLAIENEDGKASMQAQFHARGDHVTGEVVYRVDGANLKSRLATKLSGRFMAAQLQSALQHIDVFQARILIRGTMKDPSIAVESSIGDQLAAVVNGALDDELSARSEQLVQQSELKRWSQFLAFEQGLLATKNSALRLLDNHESSLEGVVQSIASKSREPRMRIGRNRADQARQN